MVANTIMYQRKQSTHIHKIIMCRANSNRKIKKTIEIITDQSKYSLSI